MSLLSRLALGRRAERLAERALRAKGYRIVARNYRCRRGEVDLVATRGGALVFVEVRSKRGAAFGDPLESVTAEKQRRLARTARHYLATQRGAKERAARFDVVAIVFSPDDSPPHIEHVENAFDWPAGLWQG